MRRVVVIAAVVALGASSAAADRPSDVGVGNDDWLYPVGLALTGHRDATSDHLLVGVDASAIWLSRRHRWYGATADLTTAPAGGLTELGVGAAIGVYVVGADLSYVLDRQDARWIHGARGRALVTIGLVGFHVGYVARANADDAVELGLLVKYPFPLSP